MRIVDADDAADVLEELLDEIEATGQPIGLAVNGEVRAVLVAVELAEGLGLLDQ